MKGLRKSTKFANQILFPTRLHGVALIKHKDNFTYQWFNGGGGVAPGICDTRCV
jgi:hypothetical protein